MGTLAPEFIFNIFEERIVQLEEKSSDLAAKQAAVDIKLQNIKESVEQGFEKLNEKIDNIANINNDNVSQIKDLQYEEQERAKAKDKTIKILSFIGLPILGFIGSRFGDGLWTWLKGLL